MNQPMWDRIRGFVMAVLASSFLMSADSGPPSAGAAPEPAPAPLRDAATAQFQALQEWSVGVTYREDVFKAVKAFADAYEGGQRPKLAGEDLKLYRDAMRDFRRAGLTLDKATRDKVEALQKQLARLSTEVDRHIGEARQAAAC